MHVWKTLKVFISSTFKDLELERDKLAQVFQQFQERIFERRLHLILYDLRWRERHGQENLVDWCLDMVNQCQYFVGILGYRYGWRPEMDQNGEENKDRISITEMEIKEALRSIPKENRFFCFGSQSQYSENELKSENDEDKKSLENLKAWLQEQGEKVFEYNSSFAILKIIEKELQGIIDRNYPPGQKVDLEVRTKHEQTQEFIEEKRRGFIGREKYLQILHDFCLKDNQKNYLGLHAVAGTGKSALLSQFIEEWNANQKIPVLIHYISASGTNRTINGIVQNFAEQLKAFQFIEGEVEITQDALLRQVQNALQNKKKQLIIAIDGLDELEEGNLFWLSQYIPKNIKIIITSRPVGLWEELKLYPKLETMELPPLGEEEIEEIVENYKKQHKIPLEYSEQDLLIKRAAGNPLFLKVALDEIVAGGIAVGQLAQTVDALFRQILQRIQATYGESNVLDYLGIIASSRFGVTEAELSEIFSLRERTSLHKDFFFRIYKELSNFVIHREGLLHFFHPEFERSVKMLLGKSKTRDYHKRISVYLSKKGYFYERTLMELPFQLQWAQEYEKLLHILGDIDFLSAKVKADMLTSLIEDLYGAFENTTVPVPDEMQVRIYDDIQINKRLIYLIGKSIEMDIQFLHRHPDLLIQCLWNRGYWHDAPEAKFYYKNEQYSHSDGFYKVVNYWLSLPKYKNTKIMKTLRPLPEQLDSSLLKVFRGHEDRVTSLSIDNEKKRLISSSGDGIIKVWDLITGECILTLEKNNKCVKCVRLSKDGRRLFSCGKDNTITISDLTSGNIIFTFEGHKDWVNSIFFNEDEEYLYSCSRDKTVKIWDMKTGETIRTLERHTKIVNSVCATKDNKKVISASEDKTVRILDKTGRELHILQGHKELIRNMQISGDGKRIVTCSYDKTLRVWDIERGNCLCALKGHQGAILSCTINYDGSLVVSGGGSKDRTIRVWDVENKKCIMIFRGHENAIEDLQYTSDYEKIISGSKDKTIRIWDMKKLKKHQAIKEHEERVWCIKEDPNGEFIVSGSKDKTINIWDAKDGKIIQQLKGHKDSIWHLFVSKDGKKIVSASEDKSIKIWDRESGKCLYTLFGHSGKVNRVILTQKELISSSDDYSIMVWDRERKEQKYKLEGHTFSAWYIETNETEKLLLSCSGDKTARVWDLETGKEILKLQGHKDAVWKVTISKDNNLIVTGSRDKTAKIWNAKTGECIHTLKGHISTVWSVGISSDNTKIYTGSKDKTIRIWDTQTGECQEVIHGVCDISQLTLNFDYYPITINNETVLQDKNTNTPIAFFPVAFNDLTLLKNGVLTGRLYNQVYILRYE